MVRMEPQLKFKLVCYNYDFPITIIDFFIPDAPQTPFHAVLQPALYDWLDHHIYKT